MSYHGGNDPAHTVFVDLPALAIWERDIYAYSGQFLVDAANNNMYYVTGGSLLPVSAAVYRSAGYPAFTRISDNIFFANERKGSAYTVSSGYAGAYVLIRKPFVSGGNANHALNLAELRLYDADNNAVTIANTDIFASSSSESAHAVCRLKDGDSDTYWKTSADSVVSSVFRLKVFGAHTHF
jgi:hypothetical protein